MPEFRYLALTRAGAEVSGTVEADDQRSAAAALREQSLVVVELAGRSGGALQQDLVTTARDALAMLRPVRTRDRIFFLRQLALMLRNGLTLLQGLDVLRQQVTNRRLSRATGAMTDSLQAGHSLSEAMAEQQQYFSRLTAKMVETAEASGELDEALERAAVQLERAVDLRRQLLTSLSYPAVVVLTSIAVATFLVWKIIPRFARFFLQRGSELPWATQLLLDISAFFQDYGLPIVVTGAVFGFAITAIYLTGYGRRTLDRLWLSVPVVGGLLKVSAMVQMSYTLSTLLQSGVTLLESLRITSQTIGNRTVSESVRSSADQVLRGSDLATSLRQPIIPRLVPHLAAVGERTGALAQVFDELARFYDKELQSRIKQMTALVEPVLILLIGGIVGFVYFAFFQAVFQLATAGR